MSCRLVPAPRGTGIVSAPKIKMLLELAGIHDVYSQTCGKTKTLGNFIRATFNAIANTCSYYTPDLWGDDVLTASPLQEFSDHLAKAETRLVR